MKYILGLDMGANSIGYSISTMKKDGSPKDLVDLGVHIFSDGRAAKTREPLNKKRREARAIMFEKWRLIFCLLSRNNEIGLEYTLNEIRSRKG